MSDSYVTVGPKSQVVIPKEVRKVALKIRPGKKVNVRPLTSSSVIIEAVSSNWTKETYGMHKEIWKGIDATDYINTIREEWTQTRNQ